MKINWKSNIQSLPISNKDYKQLLHIQIMELVADKRVTVRDIIWLNVICCISFGIFNGLMKPIFIASSRRLYYTSLVDTVQGSPCNKRL